MFITKEKERWFGMKTEEYLDLLVAWPLTFRRASSPVIDALKQMKKLYMLQHAGEPDQTGQTTRQFGGR